MVWIFNRMVLSRLVVTLSGIMVAFSEYIYVVLAVADLFKSVMVLVLIQLI